jgi:hypothetical protein
MYLVHQYSQDSQQDDDENDDTRIHAPNARWAHSIDRTTDHPAQDGSTTSSQLLFYSHFLYCAALFSRLQLVSCKLRGIHLSERPAFAPIVHIHQLLAETSNGSHDTPQKFVGELLGCQGIFYILSWTRRKSLFLKREIDETEEGPQAESEDYQQKNYRGEWAHLLGASIPVRICWEFRISDIIEFMIVLTLPKTEALRSHGIAKASILREGFKANRRFAFS